MATVTVCGRAYEDVEPDRVRLAVVVQADAADGAGALALVAERSAAADAALDAAGELILLRRPAAVTMSQRWSQTGQVVVGQTARRAVTVEARAGGALGELLAALVAVPGTTVESTEWLVERTNPVHARLRGAAVADAAARAADYGGAAGLRVGEVETVTEPEVRSKDGWHPQAMPAVALAFPAGGGSEPVLELRPQPVPVQTTVEVRYALLG